MKVIIADDELRICTLIKELIRWDELGLEFCGIYQSALSVLDHLQREKADILLCDIEMPGMSGLDLIEQVSREFPDCRCIIISGYRNFEYAQQALKYGVTRYLLKPIDENELNDVLADIVSSCSAEKMQTRTERMMLITSITNGVPIEGISEANRRYGFHFKEGLFNFIKLMVPHSGLSLTSTDRVRESMLSYLYPNLSIICNDSEIYNADDNVAFILINYDDTVEKKMALDSLFLDAISNINGLTLKETYISVGLPTSDVSEIMNSFDLSEIGSWQRMNKNRSSVLYTPSDYRNEICPEMELTLAEKSAMTRIIENGGEGVDEWLKERFKDRKYYLEEEPHNYYVLSINILMALFNAIYNLGHDQAGESINSDGKLTIIKNSMNPEELRKNLAGMIEESIRYCFQDMNNESSDYIKQAMNYITRHYNKDITLEDVASKLDLNYNYVSSLFKNETGISYKQYLTKIRIDNAKKMLIETNMTLSEIAVEVGYRNAFYFATTFQNVTGIRPKEYRKLHRVNK